MQDLALTQHQIMRGTTFLHYWLAGPSSCPLVVFTHGGLMDHRMFEAQLASVAREYRVLLWDIHGHGQSQPMGMGGAFTLRTVVDDLLAIVDLLGYRQACFVGQSLGSSITQELAFLYPERVTALVVIGGMPLMMEHPQTVLRRLQGQPRGVLSADVEPSLGDMVALRPAVKAYVQEAASRVGRETLPAIRKALPGFFHEEADYHIPIRMKLRKDEIGSHP